MSALNEHAGATLVRASQAEVIGTQTSRIVLLADFATTGGAVSANRTMLSRGTDGPPPHYHRDSAEIFFVLRGSLLALAGDRVQTLQAGDFLSVPRSMPHAFASPPDAEADVLIVFAPAANERFEYFRLVDRVIRGQADPQEILDTQERFDNHFVDSPAWRAACATVTRSDQ
jgi:quercetin dioxygenase-like cupin family protein